MPLPKDASSVFGGSFRNDGLGTDMFVEENVSLQLQFYSFDRFSALVYNVDVYVDVGSTDPYLAMEPCCDLDDLHSGVARFDVLIRCGKGTR
jgi:hypothetical protein